MILNRTVNLVAALVSTAMLVACTGSTSQTSVDRVARAKELPNAPYSNVLVVGITPRGSTARELEEELVKELRGLGVTAIGYRRTASRADVSEELVRQIAAGQQAGAVLVTSVRLVNAQRQVTGERTDIQAQVKGGGLVDFFRYDYEEYTSPASTDYTLSVQFITDMFDVEMDERIYTVESSTGFAETSSEIIVDESREIARRLRKDKMIR